MSDLAGTLQIPIAPLTARTLFSRITITDASGNEIATVNPYTRVRTNADGSKEAVPPPPWLADSQKFYYQSEIAKKKRKEENTYNWSEKKARRKTRDWQS